MYAKKILNDWDLNQKYFYQICPKEMLDKLEHPISLQESKKQAV